MRTVLYLFLAMAGLSGCVTRNSGSKEQFSAYKDSMTYTRLDTSCLHYNRQTRLRGTSRLKEISFSLPDSSGKQHVERVVYATEEWNVADSAEILSAGLATTKKQVMNTGVSTEKTITKHESRYTGKWMLVLLLLPFVYWLWREWSD